jgi:hypothetical protein
MTTTISLWSSSILTSLEIIEHSSLTSTEKKNIHELTKLTTTTSSSFSSKETSL